MAYFLVGYDLKSEEGETRNYGPIEKALVALDSVHTQKSVWYVCAEMTAATLYAHLAHAIEDRDLLMVVDFSSKPVLKRALKGTKAWLTKHGLFP